jgi:hypothetical protein
MGSCHPEKRDDSILILIFKLHQDLPQQAQKVILLSKEA